MRPFARIAALFLFAPCAWSAAQTTPPQEPAPAPQAQSQARTKKKIRKHENDYVIRGTVFNDQALALPGADVRVRRSGEKKYRWQTRANSRGEFAVRVFQGRGTAYEVQVRARGFAEQSRAADSTNGEREENFFLRLQPAQGKKEKEKP